MNSLAINRNVVPDQDASSCVLAIEPDANQALVLERVLSGRIRGRLVVVGSTEAALKALVDTIPDLVLVSPLLSPRTEDQFLAHLRALGVDASHLQILSIPRFGDSEGAGGKKRPFRLHSLKKLAGVAPPSCDPVAFANEVAAYLAQVSEARHNGLASIATVETPSPETDEDDSGGVRFEDIEGLLDRLQADSRESQPDAEAEAEAEPDAYTDASSNSSPQSAVEATISEAIPGPDVMAMQSAHELLGNATRDPNSPRLPRFLTLDDQISASLRALLDEADGCLKMSFFTGGGACAGRALDLMLSEQGIAGDRAHQIQEIGKKHPAVADSFLRVLALVMNDPSSVWEGARLTLAIVILKAIAYEIYVLGPERTERATYVIGLLERFNSAGKLGTSAA